MTTAEAGFARVPLYAVLFHGTPESGSYSPVVDAPYGPDSEGTVPHGFDREVAAALPGLWYCLHLPNTFWELIDVPAHVLKAAWDLHLDHRILLAPVEVFDREHVGGWLAQGVPLLAVCPDDLLDDVTVRSEALGFAFPPVAYSQLSSDSVRTHWQAIHANLGSDAGYLGREPSLTQRLDLAPIDLPSRWLARQFGNSEDSPTVNDDARKELVAKALWHRSVLAATARLEREQATLDEAECRMPQVIEEERVRLRVPAVLAVPGVAPAYARIAYDRSLRQQIRPLAALDEADTWSPIMGEREDAFVERAAIEFAATHRAVARGGVGLMLPSISPAAFSHLLQIEQHFAGPTQRGPVVWRLLERMNAATADLWTDEVMALVTHASMLTIFSNFPLGLLRMPGDTSPLSARVPIAYRPLLPLTRAVQMELAYVAAVDLSERLHVLVAECIPAEDPVGAAARAAWNVAAEIGAAQEQLSIDVVETLSVAALRTAVAEYRPHILVISAHGALAPNRSVAGLRVGDELLFGPGFGPLPPVVILSACHVAPRGAGTVSVTDMLLREGAVAVLGTQVPVDVRRNAMLTVRFLVYMSEVLAGREPHSTLLEIWHRVQTSNAVNDILAGSRSLHVWATSPAASGLPVVQEFMRVRSAGRLRRVHIYADTEEVLGEIADEQGNGARVRNWFRRPGYVPESLFYVFAGAPERIYLRPLLETVQNSTRDVFESSADDP
jgi:hypothetical protein